MSTTDEFLRDYDEEGAEREIARLEVLREELALIRRLKALRNGKLTEDAREPDTSAPSSMAEAGGLPIAEQSKPATRRLAIEAVMKTDPGRAWKLSAIRDALIQRKWLADTEEDYHRVQVAVSRMFRRNHLERPEIGHYRLPPAQQAALEDAAGSEDS